MGFTREQRILKQSKPKSVNVQATPLGSVGGSPMIMPNHSGISHHPEATGTFVLKAGDTMTGELVVNAGTSDNALHVLGNAAAGGTYINIESTTHEANLGIISPYSDWYIYNANTTGDLKIYELTGDDWVTISKSTGDVTLIRNLVLSGASANIKHDTDLDLYPTNQTTIGMRLAASGGNLAISALGTSTIDWADTFDMNTNKITDLGTPTASTDAATKGYVDTEVAAIKYNKSFYIQNPSGADDFPVFFTSQAITITGIWAETDTGTVDFNLQHRAHGAAETTTTTKLWNSDVQADDDGYTTTSFTDATVTANNWLTYVSSAVASAPTSLWLAVEYTVD